MKENVLRTRRALLIAVLALVSLVAATAGAAAVTDPVNGPYPQVHGELVTGVPSTASCTTTIAQDFPFKDTAYGSDPPFTGDYVPTCTGPWSKVVLTMSAKVATGTQFDRIGDVLIGNAELLHLTTPEGEAGTTSWSIQRDVSAYASLFSTRQPTYFIIGNQTDSTYTGIFYGTLALTFYAVGAGAPQLRPADAVLPLSTGVNRGLPTRSGDQPVTTAVTLPVNTTALTAEVFASGHGTEEEDWWNAPFACASGGIPYREAGISIDGTLAGAAPVFPTIYTGGYGPDFWRPIPSPRALNLRPYSFDLSPWIGVLTDGAAHRVDIRTLGQTTCSGYWFLGGNLLVTTNSASSGRTTGQLISHTGDPGATSTTLGEQGATASDHTTSSHHLDTVGSIQPAGAASPTTVHVVQDMSNTATDAALDVLSDWTWDSSSTRTTDGHATTQSQHSTYELLRDGAHWGLTDDQDTTMSTDGTTTATTSLADSMQTVGPVLGVTGVVGASQESWKYTAADGSCVDHELAAAVQNTILDTTSACGSGTPGDGLPETPLALALPLVGVVVLVAARRRRRRS